MNEFGLIFKREGILSENELVIYDIKSYQNNQIRYKYDNLTFDIFEKTIDVFYVPSDEEDGGLVWYVDYFKQG